MFCFGLFCSALHSLLANLEGLAKWAKAIFEGVPTLRYSGLGTLATSLEGEAKWAKAIFEGVPTLRHPGLGTLTTRPTARTGLDTLA